MAAEREVWRAGPPEAFARARGRFGGGPALLVAHADADGLAAAALLARALARAARSLEFRNAGRGESPWSDPLRARPAPPGGLVALDLGVREGPIRPGTPPVVIDHHVPEGTGGDGALVISGHGVEPEAPTPRLVAFGGGGAVAAVDGLFWLAALGIVGDLGATKPPSRSSRPRRPATGRARSRVRSPSRPTAPRPFSRASTPRPRLGGRPRPRSAPARRGQARTATLRGPVAPIRVDSPCQTHSLLAQAWRGRLKDRIVIAANARYRPGRAGFAARSAAGTDLVAFLEAHAPEGAGDSYGGGLAQALGGALRPAAWNELVAGLGFGPEAGVVA